MPCFQSTVVYPPLRVFGSNNLPAYGYFYSACGNSPQICQGGSGGNSGGNSGGGGSVTQESEPSSTAQSSQRQSPPPAASTSIPSPASSPSKIPQQTSATQGGSTGSTTTGAAASAVTTLASACISMVDIFEQCTKNTPGFTNLVYSEQAYCYWYDKAQPRPRGN